MGVFVYACRNCNLGFEVGSYHGARGMGYFDLLVCHDCGLMYQLHKTHHYLYHPIDVVRNRSYSNLPYEDYLERHCAIKDNIHDDMSMSKAKEIMATLPIGEWYNKFENYYKVAQTTLSTDIDKMTVKHLQDICDNYDHTRLEQYCADEIVELLHGMTFWNYQDGIIEPPIPALMRYVPHGQFNKQISEPLTYRDYDRQTNKNEVEAYKDFQNVTCVRCSAKNSILRDFYDKLKPCPRCNESSIESILMWMT